MNQPTQPLATQANQPSRLPEYGAELVGTLLMVFIGLSAVTVDFSPDLPVRYWLPDAGARRLLTGLVFAGGGSLVAISPLGKLSGAHLNPVVSMAFWLQGKMHHTDFMGYVISQLLGGVAGTALLAGVWGHYARTMSDGLTSPGLGHTVAQAFEAEVIMTFLLVFLILLFVSRPTLLRYTPLMTWLLVATLVWVGAPISGTSLNPARSFGPALVSGQWAYQWLYWLAPSLGSLLALGAFQVVPGDVLTGKLFHSINYRSLFKRVQAPSRHDGQPA